MLWKSFMALSSIWSSGLAMAEALTPASVLLVAGAVAGATAGAGVGA